ncbi:hypothetical protein ACWEU6_14065 [Streptosporangium sandarakinum]|uniref:hypothetical protein n=1 Tax=Streptosporangium sandarakinum TaxID=1260955 RepID=UPI00369AFD39
MSIEVTYDERLRAVPVDREAYAAMVGGLKADLARLDAEGAADPSEVFRLLRRVGFGLVVLGEHGEAVSHLERALLLAENPAALTAVRNGVPVRPEISFDHRPPARQATLRLRSPALLRAGGFGAGEYGRTRWRFP